MKQIEQLMQQVNGSTFISLVTQTNVKLPGGKQNPLQNRVTKLITGSNVMVFQNKTTNAYENMVGRRLLAEGKDVAAFELSPRVWGERVPNSPFVTHKGNLYLEVIFISCGDVQYRLDGNDVTVDQLSQLSMDNGFMFEVVDKAEGEQGGLENKVIIRTFNVDNVKEITINKQHYVL
jgi:hypothetical protein